jgi:hypothetical protein
MNIEYFKREHDESLIIFSIREFKALGITRQNIEICAYDFFAHQVLAEFDGVLGLDFIDDYKICIDFKKSFISIQ